MDSFTPHKLIGLYGEVHRFEGCIIKGLHRRAGVLWITIIVLGIPTYRRLSYSFRGFPVAFFELNLTNVFKRCTGSVDVAQSRNLICSA
jgi:hypothetical protein